MRSALYAANVKFHSVYNLIRCGTFGRTLHGRCRLWSDIPGRCGVYIWRETDSCPDPQTNLSRSVERSFCQKRYCFWESKVRKEKYGYQVRIRRRGLGEATFGSQGGRTPLFSRPTALLLPSPSTTLFGSYERSAFCAHQLLNPHCVAGVGFVDTAHVV